MLMVSDVLSIYLWNKCILYGAPLSLLLFLLLLLLLFDVNDGITNARLFRIFRDDVCMVR